MKAYSIFIAFLVISGLMVMMMYRTQIQTCEDFCQIGYSYCLDLKAKYGKVDALQCEEKMRGCVVQCE